MIQHFFTPDNCQILPESSRLRLEAVSQVPKSHIERFPRIAHAHDDMVEVCLCMGSSGEIIIDHRTYHLQDGDIFIVNAGQVHDRRSKPNRSMDLICISFSGLKLPNLNPNQLVPDGVSPVISTGEHYDGIYCIMKAICKISNESFHGSVTICNQLLRALVCRIKLLIKYDDQNTFSAYPYNAESTAQRVRSYINAFFMDPLTLDSISNALNISSSYISHAFKEVMGISPMQYLARRRLGEAETLLISTERSVTDIALSIGYGTVSNFNYSFQKKVGLSPTQYRSAYRNTAVSIDMH